METFINNLIEEITIQLNKDPFKLYTVENVNGHIEISYSTGGFVLGTVECDGELVHFYTPDSDTVFNSHDGAEDISEVIGEEIMNLQF